MGSYERRLSGRRPTFRTAREGSNFYRILLWLSLILVGAWVLLGWKRGEIISPLDPTPTPTRVAEAYLMEAEAFTLAGKLDDPTNQPGVNDAIDAYQAALKQNPNNLNALRELARIQAYSSLMLRTDAQRLQRLEEAVDSANKAVALAPDDSTAHAILAFTLDWYASNSLVAKDKEKTDDALVRATNESIRANQLDPQNPYALAYYAEVLADTGRWLQASQYAEQAVYLGDNLMDTHRVKGYVHETLAEYRDAIAEYVEAADLAPNMTFLYVNIGITYREALQRPDKALDYFDRAAKINDQLGFKNPLPYIEIAKTYTQQGEFFSAALNAEKALDYDQANASTYGQLGIIYIKARNFEGAMPLLKCAVRGCTAQENKESNDVDAQVKGLDMTNLTIAYYYVEYGTVLAFLSRPLAGQNFCTEARQVLSEVRLKYPDDSTLMAIVEDSEGICRQVDSGAQPVIPTAEPVGTPMPGSSEDQYK